jgi:hypothetical protein
LLGQEVDIQLVPSMATCPPGRLMLFWPTRRESVVHDGFRDGDGA